MKKTGFSFLFINRVRQTICPKICFLTTKREIEIRTILFRTAATSIVQCIRQGQHTGTLDSIYNHPRLPKLSKWKDGDLYWMIDSTEDILNEIVKISSVLQFHHRQCRYAALAVLWAVPAYEGFLLQSLQSFRRRY